MPTRLIFCSKEQQDTKHKVTVTEKEVIFSCLTCDSFVKFDRALGKVKIAELLIVEGTTNKRPYETAKEDLDKVAREFAD